ncbi:MAG TPA: hypothetical protein VMC86_01775 [Gemmatimonadales bacterium]|nr:hypothetical protein [Gemmatimonadales bacterium]
MADWIGWIATAIVVCSYVFKRPATLRRIQAVGALLWLTYGVMIHSNPVIVANVFVAAAAIGSSFLRFRKDPLPG